MPQTDVGRSEDLLTELSAWVRLETPTTDAAAVNRLMDVAEAELARAGAALTRIPGRDGFGDNLIARTPGDVLATRFGSNSLARHLHECRRLNLACELVNLPRPAVDLDLVADLMEFMRVPSATHTFRQLARLGLAEG